MKSGTALRMLLAAAALGAPLGRAQGQGKSAEGPAIRLARVVADRVIRDTDLSLRRVAPADTGASAGSRQPVLTLAVKPDAAWRQESYAEWNYANGTVLLSMFTLSRATGDSAYGAFAQRVCAFTLDHLPLFRKEYAEGSHGGAGHRIFERTMLDNTGGSALPYAELLSSWPDERLRTLVEETGRYVSSGQMRLPDGTLCRPDPPPSTVWADDLFMSLPFLVRRGEQTRSGAYFDDAAAQAVNFHRYLADSATGLYRHGYFAGPKQHSPFAWGRANGWVIWAETEVLLHLPKAHPSYPAVAAIFRRHMQALAAVQGRSGLWHQVLDHPESFEETSCSAMFMLGLARGIRLGVLDESFREHLQRAWRGVRSKVTEEGVVRDVCEGTGIGTALDFYLTRKRFDNDPHGIGAVITAFVEADGMIKGN